VLCGGQNEEACIYMLAEWTDALEHVMAGFNGWDKGRPVIWLERACSCASADGL
jgi:hypothetical protein